MKAVNSFCTKNRIDILHLYRCWFECFFFADCLFYQQKKSFLYFRLIQKKWCHSANKCQCWLSVAIFPMIPIICLWCWTRLTFCFFSEFRFLFIFSLHSTCFFLVCLVFFPLSVNNYWLYGVSSVVDNDNPLYNQSFDVCHPSTSPMSSVLGTAFAHTIL